MTRKNISHYRIIEQLGPSEMYLAEDTKLGRRVVLKVITGGRSLMDADAVARLSHPNVAVTFGHGKTLEGFPYIVTELLEGEPLSARILRGPLPLQQAVRIVLDVAGALGEAHRRGVVHRNLKPDNIILTSPDQTKVVDFGVVRLRRMSLLSQPTPSGPFVLPPGRLSLGTTPHFPRDRSRRQIDYDPSTPGRLFRRSLEHPADPRDDLFNLGMVLYATLTGQRIFSVTRLGKSNIRAVYPRQGFPNFSDLVPPELARITMKAIAPVVEDRYQSAEEFDRDLRAVLQTLADDRRAFQLAGTTEKRSSPALNEIKSDFDNLLADMQTSKSRAGLKVAFESSPTQLGQAAVRQARKKR